MTPLGWFVLLAVLVGLMVIVRTWFPGLLFPLRPFPGEWRGFLERHVRFYRHLRPEHRKKFERDVQEVLRRGRIRGKDGYQPDQEVRLLIAAGFATLFHAKAQRVPAFKFDVIVVPGGSVQDVLAVPGRIAARVMGSGWMWGPMYVAAGAVRKAIEDPREGGNPVLHRLAHYLDFNLKDFALDDVPVGLGSSEQESWRNARDQELARLKKGSSPLPQRALEGKGELFACAVEMFFEDPGPLKVRSPKLYELLDWYFLVDTAELFSGKNSNNARVAKYMMPCPHCQEEIEWGLKACPLCGKELDDSYLVPDKPKGGGAKKARAISELPRQEQVNRLGLFGVALAFLGVSAIIVTVFARLRFPWMESAWPSLQLLFGGWVLWMRRREWRWATFVPLAIGFMFRGLQLGLSEEEWSDVTLAWPFFLFLAGMVWVFVSSPAWREANDAVRWWPWPRKDKGDGK